MHIEWMDMGHTVGQYYYLLCASRCDTALVVSCQRQDHRLAVAREIAIGKGVFCLYCDWVLTQMESSPEMGRMYEAMGVVSSNGNSVYQLLMSIREGGEMLEQQAQVSVHIEGEG